MFGVQDKQTGGHFTTWINLCQNVKNQSVGSHCGHHGKIEAIESRGNGSDDHCWIFGHSSASQQLDHVQESEHVEKIHVTMGKTYCCSNTGATILIDVKLKFYRDCEDRTPAVCPIRSTTDFNLLYSCTAEDELVFEADGCYSVVSISKPATAWYLYVGVVLGLLLSVVLGMAFGRFKFTAALFCFFSDDGVTPEANVVTPEANGHTPNENTPLLVNYNEEVDPIEEIAPIANEVAPLANEETDPIANEITPLANEDVIPFANEDSTPLANHDFPPLANDDGTPLVNDDVSPFVDDARDNVAPLADDITPLADDITPLADDVTPLADDDTPLDNNVYQENIRVTEDDEEEPSDSTTTAEPVSDSSSSNTTPTLKTTSDSSVDYNTLNNDCVPLQSESNETNQLQMDNPGRWTIVHSPKSRHQENKCVEEVVGRKPADSTEPEQNSSSSSRSTPASESEMHSDTSVNTLYTRAAEDFTHPQNGSDERNQTESGVKLDCPGEDDPQESNPVVYAFKSKGELRSPTVEDQDNDNNA